MAEGDRDGCINMQVVMGLCVLWQHWLGYTYLHVRSSKYRKERINAQTLESQVPTRSIGMSRLKRSPLQTCFVCLSHVWMMGLLVGHSSTATKNCATGIQEPLEVWLITPRPRPATSRHDQFRTLS